MQDKDLKVGILGFGSRGVSLVAPILNNNIHNRLTVVIDPDVSRARHYMDNEVAGGRIPGDEAQAVRFVKSLDELAAGEIDALFLTANEQVRTQFFAQAIRTGAFIYSEKGLSNDLAGARTIVEAMKGLRPGQAVFMGFNLRYYPPLVQVKKIIADGRIGNILFVHYLEMMRFHHGSSFYMRFHRDIRNSGGMLVTKSCHDFDLIGYCLNSRPERVFSAQHKMMFGKGGPEARDNCHTCNRTAQCEFGRMHRLPNRKAAREYGRVWLDANKVTTDGYCPDACVWRQDTELHDLSDVLLDYKNGARATYTQVLFSPVGNRIMRIFGDRGSLCFDENDRSATVLDRWSTQVDRIVTNPQSDGHGGSDTGVVNAFFRMVRQKDKPESMIADGVWALATAMAAYESARTERWVPVRPLVEQVGAGLE